MRAKFLVSRLGKLVIPSRNEECAFFFRLHPLRARWGALQLERLEGPILRSDQQLAVEGGFGGAAVERLFRGKESEVRIVILLREMREHQIARAGVKPFRVSQIFADSVI